MENKQIYIAGDLMTKGSQLQREAEAVDIRALGFGLYNPQENDEINDKKNANQDGLAERIVKHDSDAIYASDIVVIEPLAHALGTTVELGQIKGRKDLAKEIIEIYEESELSDEDALTAIYDLANQIVEQKVYPHYGDIRRVDGLTETGDRRSLGINQYVYGTVLDLTDGKGFYEWDEILADLGSTRKESN